MKPQVFCLVTNRERELQRSSSLVFDSIRTGFPNSRVTFYSNASPAADEISARAKLVDAKYVGLGKETTHADWLEAMIGLNEGPIAIVDPDVVFWAKVEDWVMRDDILLAGRRIPTYRDAMFHELETQTRIHPSFWWIPSAERLWDTIEHIRKSVRWSGGDTWRPFEQYVDWASWRFWDTGAQLSGALRHNAWGFQQRELDTYDHLFAGSTPEIRDRLIGHTGDIERVRGIWKMQQRYFERRVVGA